MSVRKEAFREKTEKFTPLPERVAPIGKGLPFSTVNSPKAIP